MRLDSLGASLKAADIAAFVAHIGANGLAHSQVDTTMDDIAGGKGPTYNTVTQAGATIDNPAYPIFTAGVPGQVLTVTAVLGTACHADETVDVYVSIAGVSCMTSAFHFTSTTPGALSGTIDTSHDDIVATNGITAVINEATTGGTAASDLTISVGWRRV